MTSTGQALTQAMYGVAPKHSQFNGCSTAGRQGLMEAQRYSEDYNGIVAGAPPDQLAEADDAVHLEHAVMNGAGNAVPSCKLQGATAAAIATCDAIDHVQDGVIEDPQR